LVALFPVFYFLSSGHALAQTFPPVPGEPITLDYLYAVAEEIALFLIAVSAILTVIFVIWSGVMYMYAGDDTKKVDEAKARLKSGIIGAAIIFGVGVIINTIVAVITGEFFFY